MEFNLAQVHEALSERLAERDAIVTPARRLSWRETTERTRRLANVLVASGVSVYAERPRLQPFEAGQERVAICLLNGHEYIEAMLGSFKARAAPCNVNYRYVESELEQLFADMAPRAIVYHAQFAGRIGGAVARLEEQGRLQRPLLLQVADGSGGGLLKDAIDYEVALAASSPDRPELDWSPDDLYILYTGGTTGHPKAVLWRQGDIFVTALGGRNFRDHGREWASLDELVEAAALRTGARGLSAAPFMHGTGQWVSFQAMHTGGTVVIQGVVDRFDPADVLDTIERERVTLLTIAGEAFAAPLIDAMDARARDLSSVTVVSTSGAALSPRSKAAISERLPGVRIRDVMGSSEAGPIADNTVSPGGPDGSVSPVVRFRPDPETCVLDDAREHLLEPGHEGSGWLARGGRIPLGYMNDAARTAATFRTVEGRRLTIPGDRARLLRDGTLEVLGRDAVTINSGGEKIFAEEVEAAVRHHAGVRDVIVVGRPSERWGSEVVAIVETDPGQSLDVDELLATCGREIARYKLPKAVITVDRVHRSPAGKADYAWARDVATGSARP